MTRAARTDQFRRAGPAALAGQLSELARSLQAEPDVAGTLAVITAAAVSNIPDADYAAITLGHPEWAG